MGGQSPSEYHIRYGILAVDLYAVASGPVDCGLWIADCGLNGEATTEQISPRRPQRTQRGTWGETKRQRTRRREGRGRREPQTRSRQPCEALEGRRTIAQWREPWESKARAPPPSFLFFAAPSGRLNAFHPPRVRPMTCARQAAKRQGAGCPEITGKQANIGLGAEEGWQYKGVAAGGSLDARAMVVPGRVGGCASRPLKRTCHASASVQGKVGD